MYIFIDVTETETVVCVFPVVADKSNQAKNGLACNARLHREHIYPP